jgi:uncharacterized protein
MLVVLYVLIAQGILGALDVLINYEWRESLPSRASAKFEEMLHGVREILYSLIFLGLAWFEWHGYLSGLLAGILVVEVLLTGWDFIEEDRTRVLSPIERLMHLVLSMGGGAYCALLIPILRSWSEFPAELKWVNYGWVSWLLSLMSIGVFGWGIRDGYAAWSLYMSHHSKM